MVKNKIKELGLKGKVACGSALTVLAVGTPAFAAEGGSTSVTDTLVGSLTTVGNDALGVIKSVLPVGLTVVGAMLVITIGIKAFKKVTGK